MNKNENKNLEILMTSFLERFEPANNFEEADETLTSTDIQTMFMSMATVDKDELFSALTADGFKFKPSPAGGSFVWLLKERSGHER